MIILIVIGILAIGCVLYFSTKKSSSLNQENQVVTSITQVLPQSEPQRVSPSQNTGGWNTYQSDKYKFEFKYPPNINSLGAEVQEIQGDYYLNVEFTDKLPLAQKSYWEFALSPLDAFRFDTRNDPGYPKDLEEYAYDAHVGSWYGKNNNYPNIKVQYFAWNEFYNRFANVQTCNGLKPYKISDKIYAIPFFGFSRDGKFSQVCGYRVLDGDHGVGFSLRLESQSAIDLKAAQYISDVAKTLSFFSGFPGSLEHKPPTPIPTVMATSSAITDQIPYQDPNYNYQIVYPKSWRVNEPTGPSGPEFSVGTDSSKVEVYVDSSNDAAEQCQRKAFVVGNSIVDGSPVRREQVGSIIFNVYEWSDSAMGGQRGQFTLYVTTNQNSCYGIKTSLDWRDYCGFFDAKELQKEGYGNVAECEKAIQQSVNSSKSLLESIVHSFHLK